MGSNLKISVISWFSDKIMTFVNLGISFNINFSFVQHIMSLASTDTKASKKNHPIEQNWDAGLLTRTERTEFSILQLSLLSIAAEKIY